MKNEKQNERMVYDQKANGIQNIPIAEVKITSIANTTSVIFLALLQPFDRWKGLKGNNKTLQNNITGKAPPGRS